MLTLLKLYSRISTWSSVGPLAVCADMIGARLQGKQMVRVNEARLPPPAVPPRRPAPLAAEFGGAPFPGTVLNLA